MCDNTTSDNPLYELAQTLAAGGRHSTATALRQLVRVGYTRLEQVDNVSDWVLLSARGIGVRWLEEVRRLSRPDWQPPSPQAIQAGNWFLSAAQFALRYWPPETLASLIRGSVPAKASGGSVEKQLALDVFSLATRRALRHDEAEAWVLVLRQLAHEHDGMAHGELETGQPFSSQGTAPSKGQQQPSTSKLMKPLQSGAANPESGHYAFCPEERRRIVEHYRTAQKNGEAGEKETWANNNYRISRKTLLRYEQEFPETESK